MGAIKHDHLATTLSSENAGRLVSYLNIPSFSLAIENQLNPTLRDRPVVLASPFAKESRVSECSPLAKQAGVAKGMLLSQAKLICSDLAIIPAREEMYLRVANQLEADIQQLIPVFERDKMGKGFIDYTGMETIHGRVDKFHGRLREKLQFRYSLDPDIGISCNKLVSKIAAKSLKSSSSEHMCFINPSQVKSFLAPLPIEFLPIIAEINQRQRVGRWEVLDDLNLMFIEDLQRLSKNHLEVAFGKMGQVLHEFAHGIDRRPVVSVEKKESLFFDADFPEETNNCRLIFGTINELIDKGFHQLQLKQRVADSCGISLKYTTGEFKTFSLKQKSHLYQKEQIERSLLSIMEKIGERRLAIKWIQVEFKQIEKLGVQLSLFESKKASLDKKIFAIEEKFPGKILSFSDKLQTIKPGT